MKHVILSRRFIVLIPNCENNTFYGRQESSGEFEFNLIQNTEK